MVRPNAVILLIASRDSPSATPQVCYQAALRGHWRVSRWGVSDLALYHFLELTVLCSAAIPKHILGKSTSHSLFPMAGDTFFGPKRCKAIWSCTGQCAKHCSRRGRYSSTPSAESQRMGSALQENRFYSSAQSNTTQPPSFSPRRCCLFGLRDHIDSLPGLGHPLGKAPSSLSNRYIHSVHDSSML